LSQIKDQQNITTEKSCLKGQFFFALMEVLFRSAVGGAKGGTKWNNVWDAIGTSNQDCAV